MRTAVMVLGIVAGAIGIIAALLAMVLGGVATAFEADDGGLVAWLGFFAFFLAVAAIRRGCLGPAKGPELFPDLSPRSPVELFPQVFPAGPVLRST
ncbi:MAG TPA: hypothetical protein VFE20_04690 [Thermoleophilia bacterium]|nr:hypothetical protein [Thermoleophilia bacterium]